MIITFLVSRRDEHRTRYRGTPNLSLCFVWIWECLSFSSFSVFICGRDTENEMIKAMQKTTVIGAASFLRNTAQESVNTGEFAYKEQLMCEMYLWTFPNVCLRFHSLCHHYYTWSTMQAGSVALPKKWLAFFYVNSSSCLLISKL